MNRQSWLGLLSWRAVWPVADEEKPGGERERETKVTKVTKLNWQAKLDRQTIGQFLSGRFVETVSGPDTLS